MWFQLCRGRSALYCRRKQPGGVGYQFECSSTLWLLISVAPPPRYDDWELAKIVGRVLMLRYGGRVGSVFEFDKWWYGGIRVEID